MVALAWSTTEGLKRMIPPPRTGSRAASSVGLRVCPATGVGDGAAAGCDTKLSKKYYHPLLDNILYLFEVRFNIETKTIPFQVYNNTVYCIP